MSGLTADWPIPIGIVVAVIIVFSALIYAADKLATQKKQSCHDRGLADTSVHGSIVCMDQERRLYQP